MTDDQKAWSIVGVIVLYVAFGLAAFRSRHHAERVARQWGNDAGTYWSQGKLQLVAGIIGMFVFGQQFAPWPGVIATIGWFASQILLLRGEWMIGTGFKWVADSGGRRERWRD